jgi:hypothetical protein
MGSKPVVGIAAPIIFKADIVGNCVCSSLRVRAGSIGKPKEPPSGRECLEEQTLGVITGRDSGAAGGGLTALSRAFKASKKSRSSCLD